MRGRSPRQSRRRAAGLPTLELLESRTLLSGAGDTAFLSIDGLAAARNRATVRFDFVATDFSAARGKSVLLGILKDTAGTSRLDAAPLKVSARPGGTISTIGNVAARSDLGGPFLLASLKPGKATKLLMKTTAATGEPFAVRFRLAGDANGDYRVDASDLTAIRSNFRKTVKSTSFLAAADVDGNGRINRLDWNLARQNLGAQATLNRRNGPPIGEVREPSSAGSIVVQGLSADGLNPTGVTVEYVATGAQLRTDADSVRLAINGAFVPSEDLIVSPGSIRAHVTLRDGRNDLALLAYDSLGLPIESSGIYYAGGRSLQVTVRGPDGQLVSGAHVVAQLADDSSVSVAGDTSADGLVQLSLVPNRTILLQATAPGNLIGTLGTIGSAGSATIRLVGFDPPSPIDNNDIAKGADGWTAHGGGTVAVVPHKEDAPAKPLKLAGLAASPGDRADSWDVRFVGPIPVGIRSSSIRIAAETDQDLSLSTTGEGEVSLSRAFEPKANSRIAKVRYRFVTSEVPGGYFGSRYNDYFRVSIRSKNGTQVASEGNSMNGLGLGAFNYATGETAWREVEIPLIPGSKTPDVVQIDVTVANVGDGLYDSSVIVDKIEESTLEIRDVKLKDIDNSTLGYLSASPHSYFSGNTRVNGTITIAGDKDDSLSNLELQVLEGGAVIGTGTLAPAAKTALLNKKFGTAGSLKISTSQLLFQIPSSTFPSISRSSNSSVQLRVVATSSSGFEATKEVGSVPVLVRYEGGNRYGQRDGSVGGDDWVLPVVRSRMELVAGATWGDMSNMNGGHFSPHSSHRVGVDADGWINGYNARDANTAAGLIAMLNDPAYGSQVSMIGVTFTPAFQAAIQNVTLNDGRLATTVFQNWTGHDTHFHIRWTGN